MTVLNKQQFRRATAAAWTAANPTLLAGESGFETDTGKLKIGDGTTAWNSLAYGPAKVPALVTPRAINGVNFDGSAAITVGQGSGTYASRPAANSVPAGYLYLVTDVGVGGCLFHSNASAWVQVGTCRLYNSYTTKTITSNSETTMFGTGLGSLSLPAGILNRQGAMVAMKLKGSNSSKSGSTVRFKSKYGSTVLADTGAAGFTVADDEDFDVDHMIVTQATGASGTVMPTGSMMICPSTYNVTNLYYRIANSMRPIATGFTPITVDLTAAIAVDFTLTLGTSNSPTLSCLNAIAELTGAA